MASRSSHGDAGTEALKLHERLKAIEDQVRGELESRDLLYRLVAYRYLNASGLRVATIEAEIRRELKRSDAA